MFITGLGTVAPRQRYTQLQCWAALESSAQFEQLKPRSRAILKKVLTGANGIETRHLALEPLEEAFALSPDALHARFAAHAPALASEAARRALNDADVAISEVDAVIISTCTGYLCPGLTSYVTELLGLRTDVLALDLVGQGCGAAVPNLRAAEGLLSAGRKCVLCVCVEVCSAAFYLDNDPGVLISACLFGDGAAAAVVRSSPKAGGRAVKWKFTDSLHSTQDRDFLRFETRHGMLRNILSPCVPLLAGRHARALLDSTLAKAGLDREAVSGWVLHAGGREVLQSLREHLELQPADTAVSAAILAEYGNVSSPFVLFALRAALAEGRPGGWWWLSSFGAGFSCHGALLEVQ